MKKELTPEEFEARFAQRVKELIPKCRYYKGEAECSSSAHTDGMMWYYEKCWVESLAKSYRATEGWRGDYNDLQLGNFAEEVGVPTSLVGLFANRYFHWSGFYGTPEEDREAFKKWFRTHYLKING